VTGWGTLSAGGSTPDVLMKVLSERGHGSTIDYHAMPSLRDVDHEEGCVHCVHLLEAGNSIIALTGGPPCWASSLASASLGILIQYKSKELLEQLILLLFGTSNIFRPQSLQYCILQCFCFNDTSFVNVYYVSLYIFYVYRLMFLL
jgi:hypothetical protein